MVFLYNLTMPEIIWRIVAAVLSAGMQGFLLAAILLLMGDRKALDQGRMTLNPFRHLLLSGVFLSVAFRMSWIEPMAYGSGKSTLAKLRPLLAVLLSFALLLGLVPLLDLARAPLHQILPRSLGYAVLSSIQTLQVVLVGSVCLGLLPLPGMLLGSTLPAIFPRLAKSYRKLSGIGMAAAAVLLVLGWFPDVTPLVKALRLV